MGFVCSKATLKKKSVSCPAGGQNCGQSGDFFLFGEKILKIVYIQVEML